MRPQQSDPFQMISSLLGIAQQAQGLDAEPLRQQAMQQSLAQGQHQLQQSQDMAPYALNEARFQDAHRQEAYDNSNRFNEAKSFGMLPDAAAMQIPQDALLKFLAEKLGIGHFDANENARNYLHRNFPSVSQQFKM